MKRRAVDNLREAKDEVFERNFIKKVGLDDRQDDVKRFENAAREAKEPSIRAWAGKTLPTLREQLAAARDLAAASGIETEITARRSTSGTLGGAGNGS
jgi:putative membrane protein